MDLPGFSLDLAVLEETRRPDPQETYDLLILGGGPAALAVVPPTSTVFVINDQEHTSSIHDRKGGTPEFFRPADADH